MGSSPAYPQTVKCRVTAYCRICDGSRYARTAAGSSLTSRGIAADWRRFPRGTNLHVPGYGKAKVDDKGGAIKGNRLDVRLQPKNGKCVCNKWGVKRVTVKVVK